jgi:uncharacterized membrane protein
MEKNSGSTKRRKTEKQSPVDETVWTYRGYSIKASEFVTAMVHFFRAEVQRANVWRQRLDTTTNWAVVVTGATLSVAFSQTEIHHSIIILNTLLVTWFLFIEARRYQYYELWSYRVRLMETDFYAAMLVPPFHPSPEWAESLAENLLTPHFPISMLEAFGRRLRRNYLWILIILYASWLAKIWLFPGPPANLDAFIERASVGPFSGELMILLGFLFYGGLFFLAVFTIRMTRATGEVLPRFSDDLERDVRREIARASGDRKGIRAWLYPEHHRPQMLVFIITSQEKSAEISKGIMDGLRRGVTEISGKGMYTGEERAILMCALTVTEIPNLRSVIAKIDPTAFVATSNAYEVLGRGFQPLSDEEE